MEYQLEIKQILEYPKSRIYRNFIRELMADENIKTLGCSHLFYFTVLSSYANFRSSTKRIDGISFTVCPGEWICSIDELKSWFRCKTKSKAIKILESLQEHNFIEYSYVMRNRHIKFKIKRWKKANKALEYNYPCQKDVGFFFLSHNEANELVSLGRCSEMDIILDLWLNTIYNEPKISGSEVGAVVYIRDGSGSPLLTTSQLAERYSISRSAMNRILKKFTELSYINTISFPGRTGSVIYLKNYLSTMFGVADVETCKEEVALALNIKITVSDEDEETVINADETMLSDEQISVPDDEISIPFSHIKILLSKVAKTLSAQGFSCCECERCIYKLSPLSDCKEKVLLDIYCNGDRRIHSFEIYIKETQNTGGQ